MVVAKCISKKRNNHNEITHYLLCDAQGNKVTFTADKVKMFISAGYLECTNLTLTSDNRLIDKPIKINSIVNSTPVHTSVSSVANHSGVSLSNNTSRSQIMHLPLYPPLKGTAVTGRESGHTDLEKFITNVKASGAKQFKYNSGVYRISGDDILLEKCLVKVGAFTIPYFCTGFILEDVNDMPVSVAFEECTALKIKNESNITNFDALFCGCFFLKSIDISELDLSRVTSMKDMFRGCGACTDKNSMLQIAKVSQQKGIPMSSMVSDACDIIAQAKIDGVDEFVYDYAVYKIVGNDIVLQKCLIAEGTFRVPSFCTDFSVLSDTNLHIVID